MSSHLDLNLDAQVNRHAVVVHLRPAECRQAPMLLLLLGIRGLWCAGLRSGALRALVEEIVEVSLTGSGHLLFFSLLCRCLLCGLLPRPLLLDPPLLALVSLAFVEQGLADTFGLDQAVLLVELGDALGIQLGRGGKVGFRVGAGVKQVSVLVALSKAFADVGVGPGVVCEGLDLVELFLDESLGVRLDVVFDEGLLEAVVIGLE